MVDGTALLMAPFYAARQIGFWSDERGTNMLDTGSPYYDTYECADGGVRRRRRDRAAVLRRAARRARPLEPTTCPNRDDRTQWSELRAVFAARFKARTRDEWAEHFAGRDACVAPILTLAEAPDASAQRRQPHVRRGRRRDPSRARAALRPRRPAVIDRKPCYAGEHTDEVLRELGCDEGEIERLRADGAVA